MWIFTKNGFASVVQHRDNPKKLLVRFRAEEDGRAFLYLLEEYERDRKLKSPLRRGLKFTPHADYPYRVEVGRERFARFLAVYLAEHLDYENFKSAVATMQGQARAGTYHDVWALLREQLDPRGQRR